MIRFMLYTLAGGFHMEIDHKALIQKYMDLVFVMEGTSFVHGALPSGFGFSEGEWKALKQIRDVVYADTQAESHSR